MERLSGEAAKRQLKMEQIRREKEEQILEEAYRLANTRHTNKESMRKLKNHEARTIAKVYEKPETAPKAVSQEQKVFTPAQAQASGVRLMHKPQKLAIPSQPPQEKYPKDKVEHVVSRLYPAKPKPLSACSSGVKFYIPGNSETKREIRTLSVARSRPLTKRASPSPEISPMQHRESIHLRPRPATGLWHREQAPNPLTARAVPEQLWGEKPVPEATQTPQPTTKDSNDTPARKEGSEAGSPTVSSISHHEDDDSFTRFTAFPEPRAAPAHLSPRYSEEALFLMHNPIKDFMESLKSPTALQQVSSPLNAYRFVVGLDESAEFIYQEDKAS